MNLTAPAEPLRLRVRTNGPSLSQQGGGLKELAMKKNQSRPQLYVADRQDAGWFAARIRSLVLEIEPNASFRLRLRAELAALASGTQHMAA